jgi:hypothetical protein
MIQKNAVVIHTNYDFLKTADMPKTYMRDWCFHFHYITCLF